jgi:hypothetical protein
MSKRRNTIGYGCIWGQMHLRPLVIPWTPSSSSWVTTFQCGQLQITANCQYTIYNPLRLIYKTSLIPRLPSHSVAREFLFVRTEHEDHHHCYSLQMERSTIKTPQVTVASHLSLNNHHSGPQQSE